MTAESRVILARFALAAAIGFLPIWAGCGPIQAKKTSNGAASGPPQEILADGQTIELDSSIPSDQKALIEKDLLILADLPMIDGTTIPDRWVRDRVRFIVGSEFALTDLLESETLMKNIGAALYSLGKKRKKFVSLPIAGKNLLISNPRVGIIQLGPLLFASSTDGKPYPYNEERGGSFLRIGSLMHEARHSDGNGANAGFPHVACPKSKGALAGQLACDSGPNGPYGIEAASLRDLLSRCDDCSSIARKALEIRIAEAESRILNADESAALDDTPERTR